MKFGWSGREYHIVHLLINAIDEHFSGKQAILEDY
jgi:hypothetical protein